MLRKLMLKISEIFVHRSERYGRLSGKIKNLEFPTREAWERMPVSVYQGAIDLFCDRVLQVIDQSGGNIEHLLI